jgi:hypothetical protein
MAYEILFVKLIFKLFLSSRKIVFAFFIFFVTIKNAFYVNMLAYYSKNNKETLAFLKLCPDNNVPKDPAILVAKTMVANALFNIDESINKP